MMRSEAFFMKAILPGLLTLSFMPSTASAAQLPDGTVIPVRLMHVINSEESRTGDPLVFVVTRDIVAGDEVLIARDTRVLGVVVAARRVRWGFFHHDPKLEFRFNQTRSRNGRVILLRASPFRRKKDRVVLDWQGRHHDLRWAAETNTFEAYVDGTYEV
jgi:hypothetical protein